MKLRDIKGVIALVLGIATLFLAAPAWADDAETTISRLFTSLDNGQTVEVIVGTTIAVEFAAIPGSLTILELKETPPFLTPAGTRLGDDSDGILRVQYMFKVDEAGVGALVFREPPLPAAIRSKKPSHEKLWQAVISAKLRVDK